MVAGTKSKRNLDEKMDQGSSSIKEKDLLVRKRDKKKEKKEKKQARKQRASTREPRLEL